MNRNYLAIAFGATLVLGGGYIIYAGRPVMKMQEQQSPVVTPPAVVTPTTTPTVAVTSTEPVATTTVPTPTPATEPVKLKGVYSMADVQAHATVNDCWTTINGGVYDLTTWVSRHPGGENPIARLCGIDGGANFNRKHGSTKNAQSALILLKIGTLE